MKRKVIALLLAAGLVACSIGTAAVPAEDEFLWESFSGEEIPDEGLYDEVPDEEMTDPVPEDEFAAENEEDGNFFDAGFEDGDDDSEPEEPYFYAEESEAEEAAFAGNVVASGRCGEYAVWTVKGPEDDLEMTISGSGEITATNTWNAYKASVKYVDIESGLTAIGCRVFSDFEEMEEIRIPSGVTEIKSYAFRGCYSLTEIAVPEKVKVIEESAFKDCTGLTTVSLPSGLSTIDKSAFYNCVSLTEFSIPDTVARINEYAFGKCSSLTEIFIPDSVMSIAVNAFENCYATLLVYFGSYAEAYAKNTGRDYKAICKEHVWEESYTVDTEATYTAAGSESIHCQNCGEIKPGSEREIPKLKKPVSMLEISGIEDKTYTGKSQKQALVVKDGDTVLREETDYTVSYIDNINVGQATIIIAGEGKDYTGEVKETFMINPMPLTDAELSGVQNYVWTGSPIEPKPVVKLNGKTLQEGKDYYLTYRTNKNTGRAGVTANGKGNYTDSAVRHFAIIPKPSWIDSLSSPKTKQIAVKWGNRAQISGFQLVLSVKPDCSSPKITKNIYDPKLLAMTVPVYNAKKTYYVRIRTFKKTYDKTYFSAWSAIKTVKTK